VTTLYYSFITVHKTWFTLQLTHTTQPLNNKAGKTTYLNESKITKKH